MIFKYVLNTIYVIDLITIKYIYIFKDVSFEIKKGETVEETNDEFENLYKGQISKSGVAILPSKRTRRIPEVKKPSLADEALSELKAEQPEIKEENLETEETPLELNEEAPAEEDNKSE